MRQGRNKADEGIDVFGDSFSQKIASTISSDINAGGMDSMVTTGGAQTATFLSPLTLATSLSTFKVIFNTRQGILLFNIHGPR